MLSICRIPLQAAIGPIEFDLRVEARGVQRRMGGGHQRRHHRGKPGLQHVVTLRAAGRLAPEEEELGRQAISDRPALRVPGLGGDRVEQIVRRSEGFRGAQYAQGSCGRPVDQPVQIQKQALGAVKIEEMVVDEYGGLSRDQPDAYVGASVVVLLPIPLHHRAQLAATVTEFAAGGKEPLVDTKAAVPGVVAHVAGVNDHEILAMVGVRRMAVGRDLAADATVVERECAEVLGDQDGWIALTLVGAKSPRWHHPAAPEAERETEIIEPRYELAVTYSHSVYLQIAPHATYCPRFCNKLFGGRPIPARSIGSAAADRPYGLSFYSFNGVWL